MSSSDASLTAEQRLVLEAIYSSFHKRGAWPTFLSIDRPLRRTHGLDTAAIYTSLPDVFVLRPRPGFPPVPDEQLRLRLPGIEACEQGTEDTSRFVRVLRWLAQKEVDFEPEAGSTETMPRATSEEVRELLCLEEDDHAALLRVHAMLELDHWGLAGGGSNADGWFVYIGPEIWRFRDVQTVDDCVQARAQWVAEAQAALMPRVPASPACYYHVRIRTKVSPQWGEIVFDLSEDELETRLLAPYQQGQPLVLKGRVIALNEITQVRINRTKRPSSEVRAVVLSSITARFRTTAEKVPEDWLVADQGEEVTDQFITEPPGSAVAQVPETLSLPSSPSRPPLYIDATVISAIRAKDGVSRFDVTKLVSLIDELNENHGSKNTYASHALLRAILDHLPPIFGFKNFNEVASSYSWGKTDGKYMKKLLEFKLQADDALHRVISSNPDLLGLEDMPPSVWIDRLLQECADKL